MAKETTSERDQDLLKSNPNPASTAETQMSSATSEVEEISLDPDRVALDEAKEDFITQWGAMGSAWGVNRTLAQIHALLIVSSEPMTTDQVMEELQISRGNAHTNLRELVDWGLLRSLYRRGERKELFQAEKDVWKMFCIITRERKKREIAPALETLQRCQAQTANLKNPEAEAFHQQISSLCEFVKMADNIMEKVSKGQESQMVPLGMKLLKTLTGG
jgi:DNA-binding transcriptional regulator GbsR (MarR family)